MYSKVTSLLFIVLFACLIMSFPRFGFAQSEIEISPLAQEEFSIAKIASIIEEGEKEEFGFTKPYQVVDIEIMDGKEAGKKLRLIHGEKFQIAKEQKVKIGDTIVIAKLNLQGGEVEYQIVDAYRLDKLIIIAILFFLLVISLSQWKGVGSIIGLFLSFSVIVWFIIPNIIAGSNPVIISIIGSFMIMVTTMYLAHGFSRKTSIALFATCVSLIISGVLAALFVGLARLTGLGSEEAYSLRFGEIAFEYKGLLLGGIIIGALGVLDDITTSQTAVIFELAELNTRISIKELVTRGLRVGREHISSLVNTLVLAYAGASLPLFLFFAINPTKQPLWFILNSEFIAEEIVRTLSGSVALILAVPITTVMAAWMTAQKSQKVPGQN